MAPRRGAARRATAFLVVCVAFAAPRAVAAKDALELYGDVAQVAIPALAAGVSIAKCDGEGVAMLAVGTGVTLGTVYGLKYAVDKERPDGGARSFPSGHTASAFAGASYLHYRYGWQWALPAYAAAGLVGYSRVEADRHDWYDVVAGAAIANLVAFVLTDTAADDVVIVPIVELGKPNFGLLAQIRF